MSRAQDLARLARTLRFLRPQQVAHRVRLRLNRRLLVIAPRVMRSLYGPYRASTGSWPSAFTPLDFAADEAYPAAEANAEGHFEFVGCELRLSGPDRWHPAGASQLWSYNLHYLEWLWAFARHKDNAWARQSAADLYASWRDGTAYGCWDEWSPYVVALRTWVLCGVHRPLFEDTPLAGTVARSIEEHARFLQRNLERDVGGNHLIKNLKALIGAGVFLSNPQLLARGQSLLLDQLAHQVLADGGHFELSPSYHCQVLGDLMDICELRSAAGLPCMPQLDDAIALMRSWLGAMLGPDGSVPNLGDSWPVSAARVALLRPNTTNNSRLQWLPDSGYVVARAGRLHLIADVGHPCPHELPAHAQADCLSFLLWVDGRPTVIDPGSTTYVGERRAYERSTAAHNTLTVDGQNQTEVWGSFRAGRRARPRVNSVQDSGGIITIDAEHDGYRHLHGAPVHRRRWKLTEDRLDILDEIRGAGRHVVEANLVLADRYGLIAAVEAPQRTQVAELPITLRTSIAASVSGIDTNVHRARSSA